ncbi:MAG: transposase [Atopobiaceae bacterium]|nr:transposase [Atopobiaceae bacterium]
MSGRTGAGRTGRDTTARLQEDLGGREAEHPQAEHEVEVPLDAWPKAAAYCRIVPVVAAEKKVRRRRADIVPAVDLGIGNGRVESINNKVKVTVRIGYGFSNIGNLFLIASELGI